ncbi:DUF3052 domain-containing protein [Streptomyces sp. J2-1]|uniref:DUF3052 domain-containing protein n=1 Tax=Streptomyces corallincola TaxID=2851888 RepID=UPI001C381B43|nr:DUF3052 domain-containing protein [Streptomyces corallincola]MBV2357665.1 DUF3052 domain-containing protein [Streptomyces corallincola]
MTTAEWSGQVFGRPEPCVAERLGFGPGHIVQEIGYDDDCDDGVRGAIEVFTGRELVDEDYENAVDVVLLWWREEDGDLFVELADVVIPLVRGGAVVLLTPKAGYYGCLEPREIRDAARQAMLTPAKSLAVAAEWVGTPLRLAKELR